MVFHFHGATFPTLEPCCPVHGAFGPWNVTLALPCVGPCFTPTIGAFETVSAVPVAVEHGTIADCGLFLAPWACERFQLTARVCWVRLSHVGFRCFVKWFGFSGLVSPHSCVSPYPHEFNNHTNTVDHFQSFVLSQLMRDGYHVLLQLAELVLLKCDRGPYGG